MTDKQLRARVRTLLREVREAIAAEATLPDWAQALYVRLLVELREEAADLEAEIARRGVTA